MSALFAFHISVHARPAEATANSAPTLLDENEVQAIAVDSEMLATPFVVSFEQAGDALSQLPRLFFEPDGSFVWVSQHGAPAWQVDGNLFDRNGHLQFVDLKGTCPEVEFDKLLTAFGWPATRLMFQLVQAAVFLEEAEFRRVAAQMPQRK